MTMNQVKIKDLKNIEDVISPGVQFCPGCTMELLARVVLKLLGDDVVMFGGPSCVVFSNRGKFAYYGTLMTNIASSATGVSRAFRRQGRDTICLALAGDGATADIGFGGLSAAAERGEHILYICYDNEAYMNTGIQRSSSTPFGAMTTTSPPGKKSFGQKTQKKNMPKIAVAHNIPYVATACPSYPFDFLAKIKKAKEAKGPAYIHVLSVCPTGWRIPSDQAIHYGRLAVRTGVFPLYEVENGHYRITYSPEPLRPVTEYIKGQGRFRHLTDDLIAQIQDQVNHDWQELKNYSEMK